MSKRCGFSVLLVALLVGGGATFARAQVPPDSSTNRYVDPVGGLSLEQAVARALENEPSLRAIRGEIDVAKGARLQSGLRPNPSLSFERRDEPSGTDNLTTVSIMWPLDLFRRAQSHGCCGSGGHHRRARRRGSRAICWPRRCGRSMARSSRACVRRRSSTSVIATIQRQHELLRARVSEGATPPLDRDVVDIELRRLRSRSGDARRARRDRNGEPEAAARHEARRRPHRSRHARSDGPSRVFKSFRGSTGGDERLASDRRAPRGRSSGGCSRRPRRGQDRPRGARRTIRCQPLCQLHADGQRLRPARLQRSRRNSNGFAGSSIMSPRARRSRCPCSIGIRVTLRQQRPSAQARRRRWTRVD